MKRVHEWQRGDAIKAEHLNTAGDAIKELQKCHKGKSKQAEGQGADRYGINTIRVPSGGNSNRPIQDYDELNLVHWRDHMGQTWDLAVGDIEGDDGPPDGYYANKHEVLFGVNAISESDIKKMTPDCYLITDDKTEVYARIQTDRYGTPTQTTLVVGSPLTQSLWDMRTGATGDIYIPTATTMPHPIKDCGHLAVRHRPIVIPPMTQDMSYTPESTGEHRDVQGSWLVAGLNGNTIPVKGINNHGGVKMLDDDVSSPNRSMALQASIEIYGVVGSHLPEYEDIEEQCVKMTVAGRDEDDNPVICTKCEHVKMWQSYNERTPYRTSGDGTLAKWPVMVGTSLYSELVLKGGHYEDWQLWFEGEGVLHLPENWGGSVYPVGTLVTHCTDTTDYRHCLTVTEDDCGYTFSWNDSKRTENFKSEGMDVLNSWTDWESVGTGSVTIRKVDPELVGSIVLATVSCTSTTDYRTTIDETQEGLLISELTRTELFTGANGKIENTWDKWCTTGTKLIPWPTIYAEGAVATDYRTNIWASEKDGKRGITVQTMTRTECFGATGGVPYDQWSDWTEENTAFVEFTGGLSCVDIRKLSPVGTAAQGCHSRIDGSMLILVQQPIFSSYYYCGTKIGYDITGYELV